MHLFFNQGCRANFGERTLVSDFDERYLNSLRFNNYKTEFRNFFIIKKRIFRAII